MPSTLANFQTTSEGLQALIKAVRHVVRRAKPPPNLTVSEWAERFRFLSPESSAEPGKWYNARAPHLVAPMDDLSPQAPATEIVLKFPSQDGKTEVVNNFVGYIIDQDPGPILVLQPNVKPMAEAWSKDRLAPMLRDTPRLRGKVADARARDSGNTITHKLFPGGHVTVAGANSPAGLASRPIRFLITDEIDRYPPTAGTEGAPLKLAEKRTRTFTNRKLAKVSSPTYENTGIDAEYKLCDTQREWHLRCPACDRTQFPTLKHLRWDKGEAQTVRYVCEHCGVEHDQSQEAPIKREGEWVTIRQGLGIKIGYWKNQLSSFFVSWADTVAEFLDSKDDPAKLQTFTNTALAETWEVQGETVEETDVLARREKYSAEVPQGAVVITAAVDCQDDRLEAEAVGWGPGFESWGIEYKIFWGDTSQPQVWADLDGWLNRTYTHESGTQLDIAAACIDSGGHRTSEVYEFVLGRQARRVFAVRGQGGAGVPIVSAPTKRRFGRLKRTVKLFNVGVDEAKGLLYARLSQGEPGPGYCHFPLDYDAEYFTQLTAEQAVLSISQGVATRKWILKKGQKRNEALDIRVYSLAAIRLLDPVWPALIKRLTPAEVEAAAAPSTAPTSSPPYRRRPGRGGFVNSWR